MSRTLTLRPYQAEAVGAVEAAHAAGMDRPAIVMATGGGKTAVFATVIDRWLGANPGKRALALAHRTELIDQAVGELHDVAPDMSVGVVKAERNQTLARCVVGSVQTLRGELRRRMLRDVGLIVVDEAHHAAADSYLAILAHYGAMDVPGHPSTGGYRAKALGVTATMTRGDAKALGQVWQDVVHTTDIGWLVTHIDPTTGQPYLVRPRGVRVVVEDLDLRKVRKSRGDYSEGDLGAALEGSMAPECIAKAIRGHAADRQTIVFAPTLDSMRVIADAVRDEGFTVAMVWGEMPKDERKATLAAFDRGDIQVLANCMVLTEGFNAPAASCVVVARPTTHAGLYVQMVGRVLRPYPGKPDALVLDVVGATSRHSLFSPMQLFGEDVALPGPDDECEADADDELVLDDALGAGEIMPDEYVSGELVSHEVDLFARSASAWLRTDLGIWFLPTGERYIAIVGGTESGTWDVVAMGKRMGQRGDSRWVIRGVSDRGYAMAWAEGDVQPRERVIATRERSWRAKRPSQAQVDLARRLGVLVHDLMRSGEVSAAIEVALATRRIDPLVPAHARPAYAMTGARA